MTDKNKIAIGDYVNVQDTGKNGRVLGIRGKAVWVEFWDQTRDEGTEERIAATRLERIEMPVLDAETVRAVVRGEADLFSLALETDCMLSMKQDAVYVASAEDLAAGIRKMMQDPMAKTWADQLLFWRDRSEGGSIWPETGNERILCDATAVLCALELLEVGVYFWNDGERDRFREQLRKAGEVLDTWLSAGKDLERIGEYPDEMLNWLTEDDNDDSIDRRSLEKQELFRACLDTLCQRENLPAIEKRGYCYYCGTKIYPQNWNAARDAFVYLYQKTGEAWTANTLGYIYYYGRCNGGVPEYEEAFRWFSIGTAGGLYESTYKLGDLFANGFGVMKNETIAYNLYSKMYEENLDHFLSGARKTKFADTAIRMGNCYRDGTGCFKDPEEAYGYYLQARMALDIRMKAGATFGDDSVKARLDESVRKLREEYTVHEKVMRSEDPFWLYWILDKNHKACKMTWKTLKDGRLSLTCFRAPDTDNADDLIMATFPAGDYCRLLPKITVQTEKGAVLTAEDGASEIVFDDFDYYWDGVVELKRTGKKVAEIETDGYRFRPVYPKADGLNEEPVTEED